MSRINYVPFPRLMRDIRMWWRNAGEDLRNEIIEQLNAEDLPQSKVNGSDCRFAINYCNSLMKCGDCCVYVWINDAYEIFYIGIGNSIRAERAECHNEQFMEVYNTRKIKSFVMCLNINRENAEFIETFLIMQAQINGWRLTNKRKILSRIEIESIENNLQDSDIVREYDYLADIYADVLIAFNDLEIYCRNMTNDKNTFREQNSTNDRWITRTPQNIVNMRRVKHMWTIDGVTKPGKEWCKDYNVNMGMALKRISCNGCTPKEALIFPYRHEKGKGVATQPIVEWWNENGFYPGSDTTSYITPKEEWPSEYLQ